MTFLTTITRYLTLASGENVFWREAGSIEKPTILLLHGFPSSSHQFRNLIPLLATKYRLIAPDLPGFGFTTVPANYTYTFDNIAHTISAFLAAVPHPPSKYSIYIFDYGAPTGLRLALQHPDKIQAIVSQNGNAYLEGLGAFWDPIRALWADNSTQHRDALRPFLTIDGTKGQYTTGEDATKVDEIPPESYWLDQSLMERDGNKEIQLDLFYDYQNNLPLYPKFQEYFRKTQVPLLAVWGKNDPIFVPPGAEAFKRDLPDAEVRLLDAGHFLLELHGEEVAELIAGFLEKNKIC
ncbi:alpha/beta hydrolase fold protein [Lophiotrema nucula]|uniref:Alpha/beta hydrolase fold protein n=1 Tax=Lophiotrema nucula TaxID=690887 RepID=A0A6A5ZFT3_9PLEO|nr:alpha/beta hydrolase fold protein [Lophiotrema nucula]